MDGIRALAVGVVIAYHAGGPVPGDLGVSAFFVLSGFLITHLLLAEADGTGTVSLRRFYVRRVLRIFPAYYCFLAFSWSADRVMGQHWPGSLVVAALTYTVNYFNALTHTSTGTIAHAWSLAVEEQFYLFWPLLFVGLLGRSRRYLSPALIALIVLVAAWRTWRFFSLGPLGSVYVYNAFETRFDNLAIGCLLAAVWSPTAVSTLRWSPWLPLVTILALLGLRMGMPPTFHYSIGLTLEAVIVAVFIVQMVRLAEHPAWSWLNWRWVRWLGTISYPLYLYHIWGLSAGRHVPGVGQGGKIAFGLVAAIGFACVSYYLIEKPFLALKRRFSSPGSTREGAGITPSREILAVGPQTPPG
ncbi:MAG TPA: acyltransferase [Gemmatimonadales bacterium]|nr:acyltransferase [Gemmatimonadales bacterium]